MMIANLCRGQDEELSVAHLLPAAVGPVLVSGPGYACWHQTSPEFSELPFSRPLCQCATTDYSLVTFCTGALRGGHEKPPGKTPSLAEPPAL